MGHEICNDNLTKNMQYPQNRWWFIGGYYHPSQAQFEGMQVLHFGIMSSTN
jgi:hypothetical protein